MTLNICVPVRRHDWELLNMLCGDEELAIAANPAELVAYLIDRAVEGVRRPGSWERQWLAMATGWNGTY